MIAAFVPDYSGGPIPDFHGVPFYARNKHLNINIILIVQKQREVKKKQKILRPCVFGLRIESLLSHMKKGGQGK
jgi:hypothetical protein